MTKKMESMAQTSGINLPSASKKQRVRSKSHFRSDGIADHQISPVKALSPANDLKFLELEGIDSLLWIFIIALST
jgi:hypothetical protein